MLLSVGNGGAPSDRAQHAKGTSHGASARQLWVLRGHVKPAADASLQHGGTPAPQSLHGCLFGCLYEFLCDCLYECLYGAGFSAGRTGLKTHSVRSREDHAACSALQANAIHSTQASTASAISTANAASTASQTRTDNKASAPEDGVCEAPSALHLDTPATATYLAL